MGKTLKERGFENMPYIKKKHGVEGNSYKTMPATKDSKAEFVKLPYKNPVNKTRKLPQIDKNRYINGKDS